MVRQPDDWRYIHHYGTKRQLDFTRFNGNTTATFKGNQFIASGLVGYPLSMGTQWTRLTPIAALIYSKLGQYGYTEAGGNGAGLRVDDTTVTSRIYSTKPITS